MSASENVNFGVPGVDTIRFHVGENEHTINTKDVGPSTTLNTYLRDILRLTGTKLMCNEGGCGTCIVAVEEVIKGEKNIFAVNSCLVSILSCHGWKIHTNEGIGNPLIGFHNIQKLLAANNGTQCGFCSSGMVMNMFALAQSGPLTAKQIENSFGGNLCRCTGYRPIMEAYKKLAPNPSETFRDIEDLNLCEKEHCQMKCTRCSKCQKSFSLKFTDSKWIKVYYLTDLLMVLRTSNTDNYMLVAGNTARGVYRPTTTPDLYIDVSNVYELINYGVTGTTLVLGANTTLTKTMKIFETVSKTRGFKYLAQMRMHLDLVAHIPVRNIGTLAGNLMMKYQYNQFQSDVFLLMVTFKATLVIVDLKGNESKVSPEDFLRVDMRKKVIKSIILNTLSDSYVYNTYKVMTRAQNSQAIVNAGFLMNVLNGIVKECTITYGAINPSFIHASKTEALLQGKKLYDNTTINKAVYSLDKEVICDYVLPDPTPEYRKNLAIALFYKFILSTAPRNFLTARNVSGGTIFDRPVSTGTQEFGTQKQNWPLSEPVLKLEALAQTSGEAEYIGDLPDQHNQLFAAFVTAEVPAGSVIQSIDTSEALNMAGVVAFFDQTSIPGQNNFMPASAGMTVPEELFCSGTVKYYHQPVGIVVANKQTLAWQAAGRVKVYYSAPTVQPLVSIKDVLNAKANDRITHQTTVVASKKGNDVKHVVKGTWYAKEQYHFHMELQCVQVIPKEDGLDIYPATQWMDLNQIAISNVLNIPMNKINIFVRRLGGAFGGKVSRNVPVCTAAALAAQLLKKPVKMSLPYETNMRCLGKRYPLYVEYEVGVNDKGVIQYMETDLYTDFGTGGNEPVDFLIIPIFENCYDYSTWNFTTYTVRTDMPANTIMRAPGTLEGLGCIESIMEHIAYTTNVDTMAVKMNNLNVPEYPKIVEFWQTMQTWGEIEKRKTECKTFNEANRWKKKGLSVVPMSWLLEVRGQYPVLVSIFHVDGSVVVSHGGIEMGQGINTKVAQVTAYKFGISLDKVSIKPSYNVIAPNANVAAFSITSEAVAYGAIRACDVLIQRMKPVKDKLNNPTWEELINACFNENVFLSASGFYSENEPGIQNYKIFGVCAADVEIDILTGQLQINRVDIIEDVGDSMSPLIDIGQCEGAFVLGIGYYVSEDIIVSKDGRMLTDRTWTYKPPGVKDIPINFRIRFPDNNPNPLGILKSKAIAEPPVCFSVAVPLAIRNAVASARTDANANAAKWFPFNGPTSSENTFLNSLNTYEQYTL